MSQAVARSSTIVGVHGVPVEVQVDVASGLPAFALVGLGDAAVLEARERVRSAIRASGFDFPNARVTVNLAPAPVRKHGTGFDLPIAIGILAATGQIPVDTTRVLAVGELGLDGRVRAVAGMLAHAMLAERLRVDLLTAPDAIDEVHAVAGVDARPIECLATLRAGVPAPSSGRPAEHALSPTPDLAEVNGQASAKRALEIAAAGGLGLLMIGPPGSGKTMLARRLPGLLPPLDELERLETAAVHSIAGLDVRDILAGVRPFRAPHHTATTAGLVGGGAPPRPGEASLAHNGVLFLDELPEFAPATLQALRQPMEDGELTLVRAEGRVRYPARFSLVAAMNPCPCGYLSDPVRTCTCPPAAVDRYRSRIGGPLLDRIDLVIHVERVAPSAMLGSSRSETSAESRARIMAARSAMQRRGLPVALAGARLLKACGLTERSRRAVEQVASAHHLTGRGITRLLRVALTIADLAGEPAVGEQHVLEAVCYRQPS